MPIRLLCTGDLHLGRYPSRVPDDPGLSVADVWQRTVDAAREHQVDAVVLTGDVADQDNKYFEAYAALKRGLDQLAAAGIPTIAVAGNHDHDVLGRLADTLPPDHFTLLGRGGRWETTALPRAGNPVLQFLGWSFPGSHVPTSPLDTLTFSPADVPTLGILHADLDQPESRYAPVSRAALNDVPVAAWLLGHIHKPSHFDHRDGLILYPGSPQPLDPGETGRHGPWLLEVQPTGTVTAQHLPLASLHYRRLDVDVEGAADQAAIEQALIHTLEADLQSLIADQEALRYVAYRLTLVGRTPIHRNVPAFIDQHCEDLQVPQGDTLALVDQVAPATRPVADLEELAQRRDPIGVLARLLCALDGEAALPEEATALLQQATDAAQGLIASNAFGPLRHANRRSTPDPMALRQTLHAQGLLLLDELLSQNAASA